MRNLKLTPALVLGILALAAAIPMAFGVSLPTVGGAAALVALTGLLVEPGQARYHGMRGQLGQVGGANVEQEYKKVQQDLKDVGDQLKQFAEQSQADLKQHRQLSEESKEKVDQLLTTQGELNARLEAAEQAMANNRGGAPASILTMGARVAQSEEFTTRAAQLAQGGRGSFSVGVQQALTTAEAGGELSQPERVPGMVTPPQQRLFLRDLLNWGDTASNSVEFVRETGFTNAADVVSENPSAGKPESSIQFEMAQASVATIAHWIPASRQVLSDAGMLQSYIDGRLRYGLKLKEEAQLLKGSGVGLNINGLYTQASQYANPGVTVSDDSMIDRLRIAMLQVQLAEYAADGIVLNPIDWTSIELTKDSQGRYIWANPNAVNGPTLWGMPVVATQSLDQDEFMTGAFQMAAQGWDREDTTVTVSTEDRDNFIKNMVTILCEERVALTVYRPEAFVKGDFTIGSSGA
ncbi:phage major capsid protein, HK97 family [Onishia taeanensis]|uniref:Phage major capsid protein, HK97 family n=1 Tax=Onishia taeanensis TaxID=284577 RepID=A0A1G7N6N7_9GAMM|nr:phage major capsid protein [Halomonas taeanensis]SDF69616.1 phage major capsid protein, HK97 family [Halomonas taeanensis]